MGIIWRCCHVPHLLGNAPTAAKLHGARVDKIGPGVGVKAVFWHLFYHLAVYPSQAQFNGQGQAHRSAAHNRDVSGEGMCAWCFHGFTANELV